LKRRKKFVDRYSYLIIEKKDNRWISYKGIENPLEYIEALRRTKVPLLFPYTENQAIFMHQSIDRITVIENRTLKPNSINDYNPYTDYETFDYDQNKDLGYIRHYETTKEENMQFLVGTDFTLIIKKLKTQKINDPRRYEYIVLNKNFKMIHYDSIPFNIAPFLSFRYKRGFVLVNKNLSKGYYYAVN
jgi:hypothetical protein